MKICKQKDRSIAYLRKTAAEQLVEICEREVRYGLASNMMGNHTKVPDKARTFRKLYIGLKEEFRRFEAGNW